MSNISFDLSRAEDILRSGSSYNGPILSRIEALLLDLVSHTGGGGLSFDGPYASIEDLPEVGEDGVIYLVETDESDDYYDEYYWREEAGGYVPMGTSEIQLQNYATKTELNGKNPDVGLSVVNGEICITYDDGEV